MDRGPRDTSREAFKRQQQSGAFRTQSAAIYAYIQAVTSDTRNGIAKHTGIRLSAVCGAVNKLIKDRKLQDPRTVMDHDTKQRVHLVELYKGMPPAQAKPRQRGLPGIPFD